MSEGEEAVIVLAEPEAQVEVEGKAQAETPPVTSVIQELVKVQVQPAATEIEQAEAVEPKPDETAETSTSQKQELRETGFTDKKRKRLIFMLVHAVCGIISMLMPIVVVQYLKKQHPGVHELTMGALFFLYNLVHLIFSLFVSGRLKNWRLESVYVSGLVTLWLSISMFWPASLIKTDGWFLTLLAVQRVMEAIGYTLVNGSAQAMLLHLFPLRDTRTISYYDGFFALGTVIGPFLVDAIYKELSLSTCYLAIASVLLVLLAAAMAMLIGGVGLTQGAVAARVKTAAREKVTLTKFTTVLETERDTQEPRIIKVKVEEQNEAEDQDQEKEKVEVKDKADAKYKENVEQRPLVDESPTRRSVYNVMQCAAFWLTLLAAVGVNIAVTVVDIGLARYISDWNLHWSLEAFPFVCANMSFHGNLIFLVFFGLRFEKFRRHFMLGGMLSAALGCTVMVLEKYWVLPVGMALIGGGYALATVSISVALMRVGARFGMSEGEAIAYAPNMADTMSAMGKTIGYLGASALNAYAGFPMAAASFGAVIAVLSVCFSAAFCARFDVWFKRSR